MRPRDALRLLCFGVALALALPCTSGVAPAQGAPGASTPALPDTASGIGRLKRDASGRIVPAGPAAPAPAPQPAARLRPDGGDVAGTAVPQLARFDPQALAGVQRRTDHETQAQKMQAEIDQIVRTERTARERGSNLDGQGRTAREQSLLADLARIDKGVHEHEMQHYLLAQPYARPPEYFYVIGPDGRRYAVSGLTPFDVTPIPGDNDATIRKLEALVRAAMAPRDPSNEDRRVASTLEQLVTLLRQSGNAGGSAARRAMPRPDGRR